MEVLSSYPNSDSDTQSNKDMDFMNYWVNKTVEEEILHGAKLRQAKQHSCSVKRDVVDIDYIKPYCNRRSRRYRTDSSNKFNGIRTDTCSPRSYSPFSRLNSPVRVYTSFTKNTSRPSIPQLGTKSCQKCPMRIAELAVPTKRQCIDTWRNNNNVLPGFMLNRLKQQVMDQRPIATIPDAIRCFKKRRTLSAKRSNKKINAKKNSRMTEIRNFCAIFGLKIAQKLNNPLEVTLNSSLQKISQVVTKDIADIVSSREKIDVNIIKNRKVLNEISGKVTIWIATILEESSYKLLEEDLRVKKAKERQLENDERLMTLMERLLQQEGSSELEEEEGPVLDLIDDLINNVMDICEPSLNFKDDYNSKSLESSQVDTDDNIMDEQFQKTILSSNENFDIDTSISDQIHTSTYDTGESISVHKSPVETYGSPVILSDEEIDNLPNLDGINKFSEYYDPVNDYIKTEINNIINNFGNVSIDDLNANNYKELYSEYSKINDITTNEQHIFDFKIEYNNKNGDVDFNELQSIESTSIENMLEELDSEHNKIERVETGPGKLSHETLELLHLSQGIKNTPNDLDENYIIDNAQTKYDNEGNILENEVNTYKDIEAQPDINQDQLSDFELQTNNENDDNIDVIEIQIKDNIEVKHDKEEDIIEIRDSQSKEKNDLSTVQNEVLEFDLNIKDNRSEEIDVNATEIASNVEIGDDNRVENFEAKENEITEVETVPSIQNQNLDFELESEYDKNEETKLNEVHIMLTNVELNDSNFDILQSEDTGKIDILINDDNSDISDELADDKNKKVKFSHTDVVTHGFSPELKVHSETQLIEDTAENEEEQVMWKHSINNITFAEPNNNLLSEADESWPEDISSPTLKPSASVSRSISSMGKILEIDEKLTSPEPEEDVISDSPGLLGPYMDSSEQYTTDELEILPKVKSVEIKVLTQLEQNLPELLEDKAIDVPKLHELDRTHSSIKDKPLPSKKNKITNGRKAITNIVKRDSGPKQKMKEKSVAKHKSSKSYKKNTETLKNTRDGNKLANEHNTEQEKIEKINTFKGPSPPIGPDYRVYPNTAPAWVTYARGESVDSIEVASENKLKQKIMESDIRKWCKDLEQGFDNLEIWQDWLENTCENLVLLQRTRGDITAANSRRRDIKDWIKLKKCIDKDAILWTKLNQRIQQRMKYFCYCDKNKSKNLIIDVDNKSDLKGKYSSEIMEKLDEIDSICLWMHRMV